MRPGPPGWPTFRRRTPEWFAPVLSAVGVIVLAVLFYWLQGTIHCSDVARQASVPSKWSFWSGCYVQLEGKWVPEERWRDIGRE